MDLRLTYSFWRLLSSLVMIALLALVGCGSGGSQQASLEPAGGSDLDSLAAPAGVDANLWDELRETLRRELAHYDTQRQAAAAITSEINKVADLSAELIGGEVHFAWTYRNVGDYDLNGEVNASDLVPLALKFGARDGLDGWDEARTADGDGNGEVNVGDVTPIAVNYGSIHRGYLLYTSTDIVDDDWRFEQNLVLADALRENGQLQFTAVLASPPPRGWYRVEGTFDVGETYHYVSSDPVNIVLDPDTPPDPPALLTASDGEFADRIVLSWVQPANATGYRVYRDSQQVWLTEIGAVNSWEDTALDDALPHTYWLRAVNDYGESDFSAPDSGSLPFGGDVGDTGQGSWWTSAHDRQRTGRSEYAVADDPQLLWTFEPGSEPFSPVFDADGTIYCSTYQGNVFALNRDATVRWVTDIGMRTTSSLTLSGDGTLYVGAGLDSNYSIHPILYALDTSGNIRWSYTPRFPAGTVSGSVLVAPDNTVYFGCTHSAVFHLSASGNLLNLFDEVDPAVGIAEFVASPAMAPDGTLYIAGKDGRLYSLDRDLNLNWFKGGPLSYHHAPVIGPDGHIYIGGNMGQYNAFGPDGTILWSFDPDGWADGYSALGANGTIYLNSGERLYALTPWGEVLWTKENEWRFGDMAIDAAGRLYYQSHDRLLNAVKANGMELWTRKLRDYGDQSPVIDAAGRLYVCAGDSLLCYGEPTELPPAPQAPVNVQASDEEFPGYVAVTWDKVPDATHYRIYRDRIEPWNEWPARPKVTVANTDRWVDTSLAADDDYERHKYWVVAANPYGDSDFSTPDEGSLGRLPADPGPGGWSRAGNGPKHQRSSPATGPQTSHLKWAEFIDDGESDFTFSEPVVGSEGRIYLVTSNGWLVVMNPSGSYHWKRKLPFAAAQASIGAGGNIFVGGVDGTVLALDSGGNELWRYASGLDEYMRVTLEDDGTVVAATELGNVYSISPAGDINWQYSVPGEVHSAPAVADDGTIYVAVADVYLYSLNADGTPRWIRVRISGYGHVALTPAGSIVLHDERYLTLANPDGTVAWTQEVPYFDVREPAVAADGTIYVGNSDGDLLAYNIDGELQWSFHGGGSLSAPVVDGGGTVYFLAGKAGNVFALNPDGSEKWSLIDDYELYWPGVLMLADDGTLLAVHQFRWLYAFGAEEQ